jgi:hypothetical protein
LIRSTLAAVAVAATLVMGMGVATPSAEASYHKQAPYHCHSMKVWKYGHWVWVKKCHRAWH